MMQLSFAYLAAAAVILTLVLLASRNRRQGWRRQRGVWLDAQARAALRTFEAPAAVASNSDHLGHLDDLGRLHRALSAHGVPQAPEPVEKPLKSNVLA
jgi:hypothetical protein